MPITCNPEADWSSSTTARLKLGNVYLPMGVSGDEAVGIDDLRSVPTCGVNLHVFNRLQLTVIGKERIFAVDVYVIKLIHVGDAGRFCHEAARRSRLSMTPKVRRPT